MTKRDISTSDHEAPAGRPPVPEPPIENWSDQGIIRALSRFAWDLPMVDADERRRRLGQLTAEQRDVVEGAIERIAAEIARAR